jgi:uncharacterized protein (TIGR03067 family)
MRVLLSVVSVLCLAIHSEAVNTAPGLEQLQGDWVIERIEANGKTVPADQMRSKMITLKGDLLTSDKDPDDPVKLVLSPGKQPAWIDMTDRYKKTMLGIYRVDGDRWEICLGDRDEPRPAEFKTVEEKKTYIMVLRRKK